MKVNSSSPGYGNATSATGDAGAAGGAQNQQTQGASQAPSQAGVSGSAGGSMPSYGSSSGFDKAPAGLGGSAATGGSQSGASPGAGGQSSGGNLMTQRGQLGTEAAGVAAKLIKDPGNAELKQQYQKLMGQMRSLGSQQSSEAQQRLLAQNNAGQTGGSN